MHSHNSRSGTERADHPAWKRFEHEVKEALELSGYQVVHDALLEGGQADLMAYRNLGGVTTRILIECKFSEDDRAVSVDAVENFGARVLLLRHRDILDHGFLVTNTRFSRYAQAAASHSFVKLLTINDLYRKIFDFTPFLTAYRYNFENSELSRLFIRPLMREMSLDILEDSDGSFSVTRSLPGESSDVADFFDRWLQEPGGGRVCLLGDYGAGKTTFCTWYAYQQIIRYLENPDLERIPLVVSLRQYTKALDVRAMMTDFLVNECGITNLRLAAFETLVQRGYFLIFVDGFDEMARYVDREVRYRTISDIGWLAQGSSKVVLTGRPSYFPTHEELVQVLGASESSDAYEAARGALDELVEYRLFSVQPFTEGQILSFITAWTRDEQTAIQVWGYIKRTYNLADLASRPVLLEMILKSLPRLLDQSERVTINAGRLYDIYTGAWIDREFRKGEFRKLVNKDRKLKFMEELAFQLFVEGKESITHKQLGLPLREFFKISDADDIDYFSHDIRTCAFLYRRSIAGYEFIHRSFQEFFLAKKVLADAVRGGIAQWEGRDLPPEVVRFAADLLAGTDGSDVSHLLYEWVIRTPKSPLGRSIVSILGLAGHPLSKDIAEDFGMRVDVLKSSIAYHFGDQLNAPLYWEFVYSQALERVRLFLGREFGLNALKEADLSAAELPSIMAVLRGRPLQTTDELDAIISSSIKWMEFDARDRRAERRKERRERLFRIEEEFIYGVFDGYEERLFPNFGATEKSNQEEVVLAHELFRFLDREGQGLSESLRNYYLEGWTIREMAVMHGMSTAKTRARLYKALKIARSFLETD
jgi:hypothetical protein